MLLVTGATGQVGTELVKQLKAQSRDFRALAHSPASRQKLKEQGVAIVEGDYSNSASLQKALDSVEQLFLLTPSSPNQAEVEQSIIAVARQVGVRQVVKLSVWAADASSVSIIKPHLAAEEALKASELDYTILRPNAFMQNFGRVDAPLIRQQSGLFNSAGDGQISFVDAVDIAAGAIAALDDPRHLGQTYDLTGPQAFSYAQVAELFSERLGRPIKYVGLPNEAYRQAMVSGGVPEWYADGLIELYDFYRANGGAPVADGVTQLTGRPASPLENYLDRNLAAFQA